MVLGYYFVCVCVCVWERERGRERVKYLLNPLTPYHEMNQVKTFLLPVSQLISPHPTPTLISSLMEAGLHPVLICTS